MNNENRPSPENENLTPPQGSDMNTASVPKDQIADPTSAQEPINPAQMNNPEPSAPDQSTGNSYARPQSAPQENIPPYGQSFSQSQQPPQPPQQPNPGYGAYNPPPAYVPYTPVQTKPAEETEPPMRIRDWLLVMLLMSIPCVNIIMLFVWAFSDTPGKKSRANYCKAYLLWTLIVFGVVALFYLLIFFVLLAMGQSINVDEIFGSLSPATLYQAVRNLI